MLKEIKLNLLRFLFPRDCLHCLDPIQDVTKIFCPSCAQHFTFQQSREENSACAFENMGPAKTLSEHFDKTLDDHVACLMASCLVVRHENLGWKMPDYITFIPSVDSKKNSSKILAKKLATMLKIPCREVFKIHLDEQVYDEKGLLYTIHLKKRTLKGSLCIICNTINHDALLCLKRTEASTFSNVFLLAFMNPQSNPLT